MSWDWMVPFCAPTFWPARVPNHVLTADDYAIVADPAQPMSRRIQAFTNRTSWNKPLHGRTAEQMLQMSETSVLATLPASPQAQAKASARFALRALLADPARLDAVEAQASQVDLTIL